MTKQSREPKKTKQTKQSKQSKENSANNVQVCNVIAKNIHAQSRKIILLTMEEAVRAWAGLKTQGLKKPNKIKK